MKTAKDIIMDCAGEAGIHTQAELAQAAGIPVTTLGKRLREPETMTLAELRAVAEKTQMPNEAVIRLVCPGSRQQEDRIGEVLKGIEEIRRQQEPLAEFARRLMGKEER